MAEKETVAARFSNLAYMGNAAGRRAIEALAALCNTLAVTIPEAEDAQERELDRIAGEAGEAVRAGAFDAIALPREAPRVLRLYKGKAGRGRVKIQLFPLAAGESHPPHAHHDLISCQIVIRGQVRMREYSLLRRRPDGLLEINEQPVRTLAPGDRVITLQRRNNIHWQEGLLPGTLLLNINWQGFFSASPGGGANALDGRCYINWESARPGAAPGTLLVPEIASPDTHVNFTGERS
ncbi:MAG: hypothetical protein D6773_01395 [Alphaproteobacteria bacterium]|nr:MAG: hypothetical protein D6773_01395 [Alphaproteobacteria bacterium]